MNQQTEKILELESCEIEHGIASHIPINIQHLPNFKLKVKLTTTLSTMLFLQCLHSFPLKHPLLYCTLFILDYFLTKRMSNYIPLTCTLKFCMISQGKNGNYFQQYLAHNVHTYLYEKWFSLEMVLISDFILSELAQMNTCIVFLIKCSVNTNFFSNSFVPINIVPICYAIPYFYFLFALVFYFTSPHPYQKIP